MFILVLTNNKIVGAAKHRGCIPVSHPAAPGLILGMPKNISLDIAEIYCQHYLEQWKDA